MSDFNGESIRKAYESRRSAVEALRAFDAGIGERALTAEEVATIGVMNADVDALDETVQRLMRDQELSERSATLDALIGVQHDAGHVCGRHARPGHGGAGSRPRHSAARQPDRAWRFGPHVDAPTRTR